MTKYHINPESGNISQCSAEAGNCPFQGVHYPDYDTAVDAAENMFSEQYGTFPGGGEKPALDVLSDYRAEGESYENTMIHLGGLADALEWHDPEDPEWKEMKKLIQYKPSAFGPIPSFDKDNWESDEFWPSEHYARLLSKGETNRAAMLEAAQELSSKVDSFVAAGTDF